MEKVSELAAALARAQKKFKVYKKSKTVSYRMKNGQLQEFSYGDLSGLLECIRIELNENGISVMQPILREKDKRLKPLLKIIDYLTTLENPSDAAIATLEKLSDKYLTQSFGVSGFARLDTILLHESGESMVFEYEFSPHDIEQAFGKQVTYLRRYTLQSAIGIAAEGEDDLDDEVEEVTKPASNAKPKETPKPVSKRREMVIARLAESDCKIKKEQIPGMLSSLFSGAREVDSLTEAEWEDFCEKIGIKLDIPQ